MWLVSQCTSRDLSSLAECVSECGEIWKWEFNIVYNKTNLYDVRIGSNDGEYQRKTWQEMWYHWIDKEIRVINYKRTLNDTSVVGKSYLDLLQDRRIFATMWKEWTWEKILIELSDNIGAYDVEIFKIKNFPDYWDS